MNFINKRLTILDCKKLFRTIFPLNKKIIIWKMSSLKCKSHINLKYNIFNVILHSLQWNFEYKATIQNKIQARAISNAIQF